MALLVSPLLACYGIIFHLRHLRILKDVILSESCLVCQSNNTDVFLRRPGVPVHQNLIMPTVEAAVGIARGDLSMAVCSDCGFVFNTSFDLSRLSYGEA